MKVKRDQITGAALVLLGIAVAVLVSRFRIGLSLEYPGPKLFPLIAVCGFVICGAGIFIQSTFSKKEEKVFLVKESWAKLGLSFLILAAYVFAMKYLEYLAVTPFALFASSTLFARGLGAALKSRILFSVIVTVVIYLVYVYVFGLTLPGGMLL